MLDSRPALPFLTAGKAHLQGRVLRVLRRCEDLLEAARRALVPAPVTLFRDVTAPWLASALCLAARLRLADVVGEQPVAVESLARRLEMGSTELTRLLDVLRAHGYFRLDRRGEVAHTPLSLALRREVAGAFAELQGRGWYRKAFSSSHVLEGWRTGQSPFEAATGRHFFDYLGEQPEASQLFAAAMDNITRFCTPFLVAEIRLEPAEKVLDVGGGNGELVRALAQRFPKNPMAVLDRSPRDSAGTAQTDGVTFHEGSFFDPIPAGYDHLLLKNVLHDWDDARCLEILTRCREAVAAGARLTVIECLLPEPGQPALGAANTFALDWNVWLTLSGQERSASQLGRLLEASGWKRRDILATATPYHVLTCQAV